MMKKLRIGMATAATEKTRPTVPTFRLVINMSLTELFANFPPGRSDTLAKAT